MPGSSPQSVASAVYVPGAQRVCCRRRLVSACAPTPARTADRKAGAWGRLPQSHPHQLGSGRGYRLMLSFDNIGHQPLLARLPVFTTTIRGWLKAGTVELGTWKPTTTGVPQGGPLSPLVANVALDGMERLFGAEDERGRYIQPGRRRG